MILRLWNGAPSSIYTCLLLTAATLVMGQPSTTTTSPTTPMTTTIAPTTHHNPPPPASSSGYNAIFGSSIPYISGSSSIPLPQASDDAPGGGNSHQSSSGIVNYYFVFLALIVAVVGAAVFLVIRRRHRTLSRRRYSQQVALSRDLGESRQGGGWSNWNPERSRGRYWQGRWRSAQASREEGLNEHGEAPPPYVPKRQSQEAQRDENTNTSETQPAVPLQTLSREDVGLKPPDYSEYYSQEQNPSAQTSERAASAESSRDAERTNRP